MGRPQAARKPVVKPGRLTLPVSSHLSFVPSRAKGFSRQGSRSLSIWKPHSLHVESFAVFAVCALSRTFFLIAELLQIVQFDSSACYCSPCRCGGVRSAKPCLAPVGNLNM